MDLQQFDIVMTMGRGNIGSGGGSYEKRQMSEIKMVAIFVGNSNTMHNPLC